MKVVVLKMEWKWKLLVGNIIVVLIIVLIVVEWRSLLKFFLAETLNDKMRCKYDEEKDENENERRDETIPQ